MDISEKQELIGKLREFYRGKPSAACEDVIKEIMRTIPIEAKCEAHYSVRCPSCKSTFNVKAKDKEVKCFNCGQSVTIID